MNTPLARLSDGALLEQVKRLVQCEREATATLVAHLAELDRRRLYLAEGCSSMFRYCTQVLHLSEHAAYLRIKSARAARRFPVILDALASGDLNLTTIKLLAPHLTHSNVGCILDAARHRSRREVEKLVASLDPKPDVPGVVRKLPTKRISAPTPALEAPALTLEVSALDRVEIGAITSTQEAVSAPAIPSPAPVVTFTGGGTVAPLAPERYKVQFTANEAMHQKLERAQDLLRHEVPDGDLARIFDKALTALLREVEKQKLAATTEPRSSRALVPGSRAIPGAVKRAVFQRDGGQCAFVAKSGRRCSEHGWLEFHHVVPFARGGQATVENIELRCRAHNQYEAVLDFGPRDFPIIREAESGWPGAGIQPQLGPDRVVD